MTGSRVFVKTESTVSSHGEVKIHFIADHEKNRVNNTDLVVLPAYDIRDDSHKKINSLSLEESKREMFFSARPTLESMLQRQPLNPLARESVSTERKGEYYISPEAFALLLYRDSMKYAARAQEPHFDTRNIIIIDNNIEKLYEFLLQLTLDNDADLKLSVINEQHNIPCYIRNISGKLKCYIGDPSGVSNSAIMIARAIESCLDNVDITVGPKMQKDLYSCFTFSRKANRYFIKHGAEIFSHIEKVGTAIDSGSGLKYLTIENGIPALLKFLQIESKLSDQTLDTIVSHKRGQTLRQYHAEHRFTIKTEAKKEKNFNTATIEKKYAYFADVHDTLNQLNVQNINPDGATDLPPAIMAIIKHHYIKPRYNSFVTVCQEVIRFFDNPENNNKDHLSSQAKGLLQLFHKKFPDFESKYHYYCDVFRQEDRFNGTEMTDLRKLLLIGLTARCYYPDVHDVPQTIQKYVIHITTQLVDAAFGSDSPDVLDRLNQVTNDILNKLLKRAIDIPENLFSEVSKEIKEVKRQLQTDTSFKIN